MPSLVGAAVCLLMAAQLLVLGFLADIQAAQRKTTSDVLVMLRRREFARAGLTTVLRPAPGTRGRTIVRRRCSQLPGSGYDGPCRLGFAAAADGLRRIDAGHWRPATLLSPHRRTGTGLQCVFPTRRCSSTIPTHRWCQEDEAFDRRQPVRDADARCTPTGRTTATARAGHAALRPAAHDDGLRTGEPTRLACAWRRAGGQRMRRSWAPPRPAVPVYSATPRQQDPSATPRDRPLGPCAAEENPILSSRPWRVRPQHVESAGGRGSPTTPGRLTSSPPPTARCGSPSSRGRTDVPSFSLTGAAEGRWPVRSSS